MLMVKGDVNRVTRARMRAAWMAWGVEPSEWVPWTRLIDEAFGAGTWEEGKRARGGNSAHEPGAATRREQVGTGLRHLLT